MESPEAVEAPASASREAEQQWEYHREPVDGRFIVRFHQYRLAAEHQLDLEQGLQAAGHWRLIERNNAAAKFPTDFALLDVDADHVQTIKVQLLLLRSTTCPAARSGHQEGPHHVYARHF